MKKELSLQLPDGVYFETWETELQFLEELHVDAANPNASDENTGTQTQPFRSIQAAANLAEPGTKIVIHAGEYRECVRPQKGGTGPDKMISYEAYAQDEVIIKASVLAKDFQLSEGWNFAPYGENQWEEARKYRIWQVKLNPDEFRGYNPFCAVNILHDRLFIEYEKTDMTTYLNRRGMVFCDGKPLHQVQLYRQMAEYPGSYWVEANGQTVHFRLEADGDPAEHVMELTCREQCFAPDTPFLSYIRVKGLTCSHAATGAPVPQRGAISCFRGHHWIIENCRIDWSNGVGIDIGNECWHHTHDKDRTLGYTVIRGCEIQDVGVCGIAGMFSGNLLIEDNLITGTGWQKMELSWEAGGIKVHGCSSSVIRRNIFTKTFRADHLWMDMFNENNRITQNLFLDGIEQREAIFIECSRNDVNLMDNNIFWNVEGRFDPAKVPVENGSAGWYKVEEDEIVNGYAVYGEGTDRLHLFHNFIGNCRSAGYFAKPVAFRIVGGSRGGTSREAVIQNNIFYHCGEAAIKMPTADNCAEGNLYLNMPGGYLRILYPAPEVCLDLQAWQEFYGFDMKGQEGELDIWVDTQNFTMTISPQKPLKSEFPHTHKNRRIIRDPSDIAVGASSDTVCYDFFGKERLHKEGLPGPFTELKTGVTLQIDPRKYKK